MLFAALQSSLPAAPPPEGLAPVLTPAPGFGIDGDLFARQPASMSGDWIVATNVPGFGEGVLAGDGTPLDLRTTFHFVDPYNDRVGDMIFTGGSKWTDDPNRWGWTHGKPSSKADINHLLFHVASDSAGHTWLVMSADRAATQGDSYIDFELLQSPLVRTNGGGFVSSGLNGGRTTNDLVLSLAFTGGGKQADFLAWRWETNTLGGYHYVDITPFLPAGRVFVALNTNTVTVPYSAFGATTYPPNAFAEAAIDLTAMVEGVMPCESFGFVAVMVKTKASTSDAAGIEDFLDPIAYDFRIGPLADAGGDQELCAESGEAEFALGGGASPGLAPVVSTHWSVVSGSAVIADPDSLSTTVLVSSATARLRLEVIQSNGCMDSDEVVLVTVPPPSVSISGPGQVCPDSTAEFSAPPAMDGYQWSISGNGSILGAANQASVAVRSGHACGEAFVLTLMGSSNTCSVTTLAEVLVQDETAPVLLTSEDRTVECGLEWDFDPVSAVDDCSGTNVLIEIAETTTNLVVGETFSAMRIWRATDACGNSSTATQTVTIVDTTPPQIICSSNVVVECVGPSGTEAFFTVTALDACDGDVAVSCVPPAGSLFAFGVTEVVCNATDGSGNSSRCSFLVTVQDTTPPEILCPADLLVGEWPHDSGSALVDFEPPFATDNCSLEPVVVCNPPSGSSFPVGETVVDCVAFDGSGNSKQCSFTVRVIPYRVVVIEVTDSGPGGLRDALIAANALPGENRIEFNISGPGPHTIRPETNLPVVTSPVILDGRSQPGFGGSPLIELDGGLVGGASDGLAFESGGNTVLGIAVFGFDHAISLGTNSGGSTIQGTYLGVDATGTNAIGNVGGGLRIGSSNNLIGGSGPGEGNLIAGNGGPGILLLSEHAFSNRVVGNWIGVAPDGVTPEPNAGAGVLLEDGAAMNQIGSMGMHQANRIGFNGGAGIALGPDAGAGNTIGVNVLNENGSLGIDLGDDGVTLNDADDTDLGPNHLQNHPLLTDARSLNGMTTVDGRLASLPDQSYRLDFYLSDAADPSGYGEGPIYLGFATLPVGASGVAEFSISFTRTAVFTQFVTATATDPFGNTSEFSQARQVRTPAVAEKVPTSTNAVVGGLITLCADASGTLPIFYQWRLNGANIPGETNQCITLADIQAQDAGAYSVILYNELGGAGSAPATLRVPLTNSVPARDNFADREPLGGLSGLTQGFTQDATREPGEPLHADKPGGKSVWYSWEAPERGVVTMGTRGSTFDTLLGVYTGTQVSNLTVVASDEDRGGYFTSGLRFNAIKGRKYSIAIDGYFGESGEFTFGWAFEDTSHLLPVFLQEPQSLTVRSNGLAEFTASVSLVCGNGVTNCPSPSHYPNGLVPGLETQWYFGGVAIPGATNDVLTISNVQPANLGEYWMEATVRYYSDGVNRTIRSAVAELQINQTGQDGFVAVQARDKLLDALAGPPWVIGGFLPPASAGSGNVLAVSGLTSGYTGTQIFNTVGSSTSSGESLLCNVAGGASKWLTLWPRADGLLVVDTIGSSYDTVMAIYSLLPNNTVAELACTNDILPGTYSRLEVPVRAGDTNVILVDGVNGASGTLVLHYKLIGTAILQAGGPDSLGAFNLQIVGYPGMSFTIECSSNLVHWTPLLSTNSASEVFNYTDPTSPLSPGKYYRAVFAP